MISALNSLLGLTLAVGWRDALAVAARRQLRLQRPVRVRAHGRELSLRPLDSDPLVASQIFGRQEYDAGAPIAAALNDLAHGWRAQGKTPMIVDAGANVGCSSLYFADAYPEACVLAVEPDPESYALLVANCASEARVRPVRAALWSHERGVALVDGGQGSWSCQVRDGGSTPSLTLAGLLHLVPDALPLIIKLDIEGAEREVCAASQQILRSAPCIMLEPHDFLRPGSGCLTGLYTALAGRRVDTLVRGENLIIYDSDLVETASAATAPAAAYACA